MLLLLLACLPPSEDTLVIGDLDSSLVETDTDSDADSDTDTDTDSDADSDTDSDADTDSDTDTDTGQPVDTDTGDTEDTGSGTPDCSDPDTAGGEYGVGVILPSYSTATWGQTTVVEGHGCLGEMVVSCSHGYISGASLSSDKVEYGDTFEVSYTAITSSGNATERCKITGYGIFDGERRVWQGNYDIYVTE